MAIGRRCECYAWERGLLVAVLEIAAALRNDPVTVLQVSAALRDDVAATLCDDARAGIRREHGLRGRCDGGCGRLGGLRRFGAALVVRVLRSVVVIPCGAAPLELVDDA